MVYILGYRRAFMAHRDMECGHPLALRSAIIIAMPSPRRFPPPWSIEEHQESFIVKDANDQRIAYLYFEDEPQRRMSTKRLTRDEAFLFAVNIAKLPSVPRQILKDIPRPPNTKESILNEHPKDAAVFPKLGPRGHGGLRMGECQEKTYAER